MRSGTQAGMEMVSDHILIRRPAIPRWWDPIARPHVAIVIENPVRNTTERIYLSRTGQDTEDGRTILEVAELDEIASSLSDGAVLEIRFSATKANLYKLQIIEGVPVWRWVGRCRGLCTFEYPSTINWDGVLSEHALAPPNGILAS